MPTDCEWVWGGNRWLPVTDCGDTGKACSPPDYPGKFIDQPATTPCS